MIGCVKRVYEPVFPICTHTLVMNEVFPFVRSLKKRTNYFSFVLWQLVRLFSRAGSNLSVAKTFSKLLDDEDFDRFEI